MTTPAPVLVATDADLIVAAVLSCPAVAALHGGRFGEIATYLPGRRVTGVRHDTHRIEVHVVGRYPTPVDEIATQVRVAVAAAVPALAGSVVDVTVEDYLDPTTTVASVDAPAPVVTPAVPAILVRPGATPAELPPPTAHVPAPPSPQEVT